MKTINYKVSYEKMITRLPGLFAYIESDDFGNMVLHKATDSLNGCYGKIIENIKLPDNVNLQIDDTVLLESNKIYSFRTIISYYYQYKDILNNEDSFKKFIEDGIGKITVDSSLRNKYSAIPNFIYLSNVRKLYNELVKLSKQCNFYKKLKEDKENFTEDKHLCCLCEKYENMGGDLFKNYVRDLIPQANEIAEKYLSYAEQKMTLDFDIDLVLTYQDLGIMNCYVSEWLPYKKYYSGEKVFYDGKIWICTKETTGYYDSELEKVIFDFTAFRESDEHIQEILVNQNETSNSSGNFNVEGRTDSKLTDLRRLAVYENDSNISETPDNGKDWLFYYRKNLITNISTINDEFGNILSLKEANNGNSITAIDGNDLLAYGDVITNITTDIENNTITFEYVQGVHLKAETDSIKTDDDGNNLYMWKNFTVDNTQEAGIKYQETYNYLEGSELDELINGEFKIVTVDGEEKTIGFNDYIDGKYDKSLKTFKFEFITSNNTLTYEKTIANQTVNIVSIMTDFDIHRKDFEEFMSSNLIRYDYFNGITYAPTKDIDVHIERGSTSVFQKHISLSEVKTLDDMIEYKNGSFFKMSES